MVFFNCEGCGESCKKNQIDKHRMRCGNSSAVSCIDCQKVFRGEEYKTHLKCISEEQKYSAKGHVVKENKGEKKQASWTEQVQAAIGNCTPSNNALKDLLQRISTYDNIPRKEKKFVNFLSNSFRVGNQALIKEAWKAIADSAPAPTPPSDTQEPAPESKSPVMAEQNGHTNGTAKDKKKKRKAEDPGAEPEKKKSCVDVESLDMKALVKAAFKVISLKEVEEAGVEKMKMKKLRQRVMAAAAVSDSLLPQLSARLNSALPSVPKVSVSEDGKYATLKSKKKASD